MNKKELIKEIKEERNKLFRTIIKPLDNLIDGYEETLNEEKAKELVGKYFVYRDNCYSCPEMKDDYWDSYYLILDKEGNVLKVEKDSEGNIGINKEKMGMFPDIQEHYEECSGKEFDEELQKLSGELNKNIDDSGANI